MAEVVDAESEIELLRAELARLKTEAARNAEKMQKCQARELRILNAPDLAALFRELGAGLKESYALDSTSVILADPDHDVRHLLLASGEPAEQIEGLALVDSLTGYAPQYVALRKPWLGPYAACDHQMLLPRQREGSVAVIPLRRRGYLIGSINFGSEDRGRFTPDLASDFLARLGVTASFAIENAVNRARLLRSGFTDVLTGWHNRRYLAVRLREELARARRETSSLVCLMLDIDHFKTVNDTYGHAAGDAVLTEIAQRIDAEVRESDVAARYGGEEFVVLLPDTGTSAAEKLADRIRRAVAEVPVMLPNGDTVSITTSLGIASAAPHDKDIDLKTEGDALLARADVALYRAKSNGRDRVEVEAS